MCTYLVEVIKKDRQAFTILIFTPLRIAKNVL